MEIAHLSRLLTIAVVIGLILYLLVVMTMYGLQRRFLYHPDPTRVAPATVGLTDMAEQTLPTPDGEKLMAWYGPAPEGAKTILYFHGNAGNLAGRRDRIAAYRKFGFGVLMLSYRGFSGSTGSPSETANYADAGLAYQWLRARGVAPSDIVLYGESLGTGVAVQLAVSQPVSGIILDAPYTSIVDLASSHYWYLPVDLLMVDRYETKARIGQIGAPLLIFHGALDMIVPIAMGRTVFKMAPEPKRMIEYPEAGHIYHAQFGSLDRVNEFVRGLK